MLLNFMILSTMPERRFETAALWARMASGKCTLIAQAVTLYGAVCWTANNQASERLTPDLSHCAVADRLSGGIRIGGQCPDFNEDMISADYTRLVEFIFFLLRPAMIALWIGNSSASLARCCSMRRGSRVNLSRCLCKCTIAGGQASRRKASQCAESREQLTFD